MHRLLVATEELTKDAPLLGKDARDHLRVLRPKDGEAIELFDGRGRARTFAFRRGAPAATPLVPAPADAIIRTLPPPAPLTLFACMTKGARWDWTIEKATELGATRIVPVISERTIVRVADGERDAKRVRGRRIAEEAARQSDAMWIPDILAPVPFPDSLPLVRETTCFVGALTNPMPDPIAAALRARGTIRNGAVYVGPEGDFTPTELAALVALATPVSFGATILRAETAAIYGLSVLKAFQDAAPATAG